MGLVCYIAFTDYTKNSKFPKWVLIIVLLIIIGINIIICLLVVYTYFNNLYSGKPMGDGDEFVILSMLVIFIGLMIFDIFLINKFDKSEQKFWSNIFLIIFNFIISLIIIWTTFMGVWYLAVGNGF